MYHYKFKISVISADESLYKHVAALPSLDGFTNIVCKKAATDAALQETDLLLCDTSAAELAQALAIVPKKAMKIFLGTETELAALDDEVMAQLDDVWELPLTDKLLAYKLGKLFARIKAIKDAHLTEHYFEALINSIPPLIWYKDIRGAHLKVNDSFCQAVGKKKEDVIGRGHYYIWDLQPEEYAKGEYVCLETEQEVLDCRKTLLFDEKVKTKRGLREFKTYKSPIWDDNHDLIGTVGCAIDVTDKNILMAKLIGAAETDELTTLYNRRYFYKYINDENIDGKPMNIFYIDLDNFKKINDRYGHQTGDDLLHAVACLLKSVFAEGKCFRFGGDEFVCMLAGSKSEDELAAYAEAFLQKLERLVEGNSDFSGLSASVGIVSTDALEVEDVDALLRASDKEMYAAKHSGKKSYRIAH